MSLRAVVRALGVDVGKAKVGLAISDELGLMAHPRPTLDARKQLIERVAALCSEEGVERIVVGLPLGLDGQEGSSAHRARRFAKAIAERTGLEVELVDERLSSVEGERRLREAGRSRRRAAEFVDGAAAAVVLQSWLDGRRER